MIAIKGLLASGGEGDSNLVMVLLLNNLLILQNARARLNNRKSEARMRHGELFSD